jgi:hypothetical protein
MQDEKASVTNPVDQPSADVGEHEITFHRFVHIASVGVFHAANILIALAIGGVEGNWPLAIGLMLLATVIALRCLVKTKVLAMPAVLLLSIVLLGLQA